jgi:hypothetical protein
MGGLTLPEAQALERNATPLQGTMIFLQRKINTLPQGFHVYPGKCVMIFPAKRRVRVSTPPFS